MDEIKNIFESVRVNEIYNVGDWCYKYYSEHVENGVLIVTKMH